MANRRYGSARGDIRAERKSGNQLVMNFTRGYFDAFDASIPSVVHVLSKAAMIEAIKSLHEVSMKPMTDGSFKALVHPDMQKELDKWYADDMLEVDTESEETDAKLPDDYGDGSGYNGFWDNPDPDA
jgi:hypothetical protein